MHSHFAINAADELRYINILYSAYSIYICAYNIIYICVCRCVSVVVCIEDLNYTGIYRIKRWYVWSPKLVGPIHLLIRCARRGTEQLEKCAPVPPLLLIATELIGRDVGGGLSAESFLNEN